MSMPASEIVYDPSRYIDIENVDEAVDIIVTGTEGMTSQQRWNDETPALMRIMEKHIDPRSRVLDYGCGIGRLAKPLIEKLKCEVVGVDISPNMRALAASLVNSPNFFVLDPAMFHTIRLDSFDAAIAIWALQHCIDLKEAIDRISDSLMTGGNLIVVNDKGRCLPIENGEWADDGQDIEKMIVAAGFSEVEQGQLDESVAPGWMQQGTFWAVYQRR